MSFPPQQGPFGSPPPPPPGGGFGGGFGGPGGGFGGPGGFGPGGPVRVETSGKATASLVLGIAGLIVCPLVCSVLAIVFGAQARNEIDRSGGRLAGRGTAQAGVVLGWIGVALCILGLVIFGILVAIGASTSNDSDFSSLYIAAREALAR